MVRWQIISSAMLTAISTGVTARMGVCTVPMASSGIAGGANVILSDIPGCGIGALDHVYLQFLEKEPERFVLMPFTCIVDPERFTGSYSAASLIINARAAADSQEMARIVDEAVSGAEVRFSLESRTFFVESFGMMDEGRENGGILKQD